MAAHWFIALRRGFCRAFGLGEYRKLPYIVKEHVGGNAWRTHESPFWLTEGEAEELRNEGHVVRIFPWR